MSNPASASPQAKKHGRNIGDPELLSKGESETPRVEHLREEHFDRAYKTIELAFVNGPLQHYLNDTPDAKDPSRVQQRFDLFLWKKNMKATMRSKVAYVVDGGYSIIICVPPNEDVKPPSPIGRLINAMTVKIIMFLVSSKRSPEQRRRYKETMKKANALEDAHIPVEDKKDMIYVEMLATHPESQGKGYASALLDTITFGADLRGLTVYLHVGNPANLGFYEMFGFENVDEVLLGTGNPTWTEPPVPLYLMIRKPKQAKDVGN